MTNFMIVKAENWIFFCENKVKNDIVSTYNVELLKIFDCCVVDVNSFKVSIV